MTSISWIDTVPFVFPPTDYVFLCESLDTQWHVKILGYASTSKVVKKLSPYLDCVDKFDLAKKILRDVIQPLSELDFVIVDMITGFQEEQLYYDKYNQTIKP